MLETWILFGLQLPPAFCQVLVTLLQKYKSLSQLRQIGLLKSQTKNAPGKLQKLIRPPVSSTLS